MKKVLVFVSLLIDTVVNAQSKYENAMTKGLGQLKAAQTVADFTDVSSFFERVGMLKKYSGFLIIMPNYPFTEPRGLISLLIKTR